MKSRKIVLQTPLYFDEGSYLGGGERYALNLSKGVVESSGGSFEVEVISYGKRPLHRVVQPGLSLRVLHSAYGIDHSASMVSWELASAIADADLVHIHAPLSRPGEVSLLVAKQQKKPVCVTDHGGHFSTLLSEMGSLDLADRVICYSDFSASLLRTKAPVEMIKGGVDSTYFRPPDTRPLRDRVLFVGRLVPHKGIDRLITALPDRLPLTICGRPYNEGYFRRLQEQATGKRVEFVTDADDEVLRQLYACAWATVLPSVFRDCYGNIGATPELMGLTLLESMACGTPAIGSRVGGMPEFIREQETGFIFDSLEELGQQMSILAGDPQLVERMGQRAREVIVKKFDHRIAGAKLASVYEELIRESKGAAA